MPAPVDDEPVVVPARAEEHETMEAAEAAVAAAQRPGDRNNDRGEEAQGQGREGQGERQGDEQEGEGGAEGEDEEVPRAIENCKRFLLEVTELKSDVNTNRVFLIC